MSRSFFVFVEFIYMILTFLIQIVFLHFTSILKDFEANLTPLSVIANTFDHYTIQSRNKSLHSHFNNVRGLGF